MAASEPASGSVRQYDASCSPEVRRSPHSACSAGLPQVQSIHVAILWMVKNAAVDGSAAANSSNTKAESRRESPKPPCASGEYRPQKPSCPPLRNASTGKIDSASHCAAKGARSCRAKSRASCAKASCSSLSSKFTPAPLTHANGGVDSAHRIFVKPTRSDGFGLRIEHHNLFAIRT